MVSLEFWAQIPTVIACTNLVGIDELWDIENKGKDYNRDDVPRQMSPQGNGSNANSILVRITNSKVSLPSQRDQH